MIVAVSIENAHLFGDVLPSQYRLRHHGFKERQNYAVPSYRGMEYDAYDTPGTVYLVWRDEKEIARGCARIVPTTLPYMIEELWPEAVQNLPLPKDPRVWEASRMCIDKSMPVHLRKRIHGEIICGLQEFGIANDIHWMIGVMTQPIWRSVFTRVGWPIEYLGPPFNLTPKESIYAGKMKISSIILKSLRQRFMIQGEVIEHLSKKTLLTQGEKIRA